LKTFILTVATIASVIIAVPTLMKDVETGRIKADVEMTDKIVHTVEIAMAQQDIYDEVLHYSIKENKAGYNTEDVMNGVTITFENNIENGKFISYPPQSAVNKLVGETTQLRALTQLNNYLQQNIGDEIEFKYYSGTDYTVFIKMGETKNDVLVWGEFDMADAENQ
jgi:hypothetical protein